MIDEASNGFSECEALSSYGFLATLGSRDTVAGRRRRRSVFIVTKTVAPVSARIAGHKPVKPTTVVMR
ncbi:hypothetical protein, partial [Cupriavidus oxalaticus]|uniref:hypothetical protein n=1 Tax=Cupriavidus oxalaticus TaxID=96344 RepID=UPI0031766D40